MTIETKALNGVQPEINTVNTKPKFTDDFRKMLNMVEEAARYHFMLCLIGEAGYGKSTALKHIANKSGVFYVRCEKIRNAKGFFKKLLAEMDANFDGTLADIVDRVAELLKDYDNPVVIIDEAAKIDHNLMLYLHDFREITKDYCGILLAGVPKFESKLKYSVQKEKEGCHEFYTRINMWGYLDGLSNTEIKEYCASQGITDIEYKANKLGLLVSFRNLFNAVEKVKRERLINNN